MRLKLSKANSYLAYSQRKLAEAKDPAQIEFWRGKVAFYERALAGRCKRCGRELSDPVSRERGFGDECIRKVEQAQVSA